MRKMQNSELTPKQSWASSARRADKIHQEQEKIPHMKGMILAGGSGTRLPLEPWSLNLESWT